jgi:flagellar biosynthesis GTPase FlhF
MKSIKWIVLAAISFAVMSFAVSDDLFKKLGCEEDEVKGIISDNFLYGYLYVPACGGVYKKTAESERVAVVNMLYDYIRSVVNSESFRQRYNEEHEANRPKEPVKEVVQKMDEAQAQMIKALEDQLNSPYLDEASKQELRKSIEEMKKQLSQTDTKDQLGQMDEMAAKNAEEKYQNDMAAYKTELAEWEKSRDINYMLKSRLQAFLDLTASIDFNANLVQSDKKMVFENPVYESKDYMWKACFRAGSTTIKQARLKATEWLNELR